MGKRNHIWIYLIVCRILGVSAYLNIISNYDVASVNQRSARLVCKIETDKIVKEVIWYKLSDAGASETVYYYEPPKYNSSGPGYMNRATLAKDRSSLLINPVARGDEGLYQCHVTVAFNTSYPGEIPEEKTATMELTVFVPPSDVKLSTFTSGKNMTLTCRSSRSKPPTEITWLVTRGGAGREVQSAKVVSDFSGNLADTIGYLYLGLGPNERGTTVTCIVNHPDTMTTLKANVTMVPPTLMHPVQMYFDWLGAEVPYTTFQTSKNEGSSLPPAGLVAMSVSPSQNVKPNSSVVVAMEAKGAFPEPSYTWWSEDFDLRSGQVIRINHLTGNQALFCLVENPVGRAVMSVQLSTTGGSDPSDQSSSDYSASDGDVIVSGAVVAAIAFGIVAALFLVAFLIYYFTFRVPSDKTTIEEGVVEEDDFDSYVKKQPLYSQPQGQTKVSNRDGDVIDDIVTPMENEALLRNPEYSPTTPKKGSFVDSTRSVTSTTTTSGYGDDVTGGAEKDRAITRHLNDFDENASFVGGYGSTFGLDGADSPELEELEARGSPFDGSGSDDSDTGSLDSGASGVEGRYTLPPCGDSWEEIDPNETVAAHP